MKAKPKPGEVWEHADGGSVYVLEVNTMTVRVTRRPPGDPQGCSDVVDPRKIPEGHCRQVEGVGPYPPVSFSF
jgi:hypothetical protein